MRKRTNKQLFGLAFFILLLAVAGIFLFLQVDDKNLGLLVGLITISALVNLFITGFFFLHNAFSNDSLITMRTPKAPSQPRTKSEQKPMDADVPQKAQQQSGSAKQADDVVLEEFPDAKVVDAQEILQQYKQGKRDFQNVFPKRKASNEHPFQYDVLDGADFSRAHLQSLSFSGTSLIGVRFNGANLENCTFRGAIIRQADLSWANLANSDLSGSDLSGSDLSFASLEKADLSNATLIGTTISEAQLASVLSLKGAVLPDGSRHS